MNKYFVLLFLILFSSLLRSQKTLINDFSKDYFAEISENGESKVLKLFDKSKKELLSLNVSLSAYDFENIESNIKEIPYGNQSIVIYDDFNFNGKKDIAIKYGNESCYGGPSYEVYLYENNTFKHSDSFSDLGQNYCGFFDVDNELKQIHTMTKSGCCWHQFSDFTVKNGKPFLIKVLEEKAEVEGTYSRTIKEWNGKKYIKSTKNIIRDDDFQTAIFRYQLENSKFMILSLRENKKLYYYFLNKNKEVEFVFSEKFFYSKKENSLSFNNDSAKYKIFNDRIEIDFKNKITILSAKIKTRQNNLSSIYGKFKIDNILNLEIVD